MRVLPEEWSDPDVFWPVLSCLYLCVMAHEIKYRPVGMVFTSSLPDVPVDVDGDYVYVRLSHRLSGTLFYERLYPYDGRVTLCDLRSLVEEDMRARNAVTDVFLLEVSSSDDGDNYDSVQLSVLFCDRFVAAGNLESFADGNFLTTLGVRRVAPGSSFPLAMLCVGGNVPEVRISSRFRSSGDGVVRACSFPLRPAEQSSGDVCLSVDLDLASIASAVSGLSGFADVDLLGFTVSCGQRSLDVFVDKALSRGKSFIFRNCFNVPELFQSRMVTLEKSEVSRPVAVLSSKSSFYDHTVVKTYESETDNLGYSEAVWADQFLCSRDVSVLIPESGGGGLLLKPVLVTSFTSDVSDGDSSLNSVKFSWRFDDNRPAVLLSVSPGVFTFQFDPVFC